MPAKTEIIDERENIFLAKIDGKITSQKGSSIRREGIFVGFYTYKPDDYLSKTHLSEMLFSNKFEIVNIDNIHDYFRELENNENDVLNLTSRGESVSCIEVGKCIQCGDMTESVVGDNEKDITILYKNVKLHKNCLENFKRECSRIIKRNNDIILSEYI